MSIDFKTCTAVEIHEINQRKEYTLISTQLLQSIFCDPNLNPQTIKCWQYLFNLARFNSNLEITISYNHIAKELNRSKRTVIRYIQLLEKYNYLTTIANFNDEQGKTANTLLVRVPTHLINKVKTTKDRISFMPRESTPRVLLEKKENGGIQNTYTPLTGQAHSFDTKQGIDNSPGMEKRALSDNSLPTQMNSDLLPESQTKLSLGPSDSPGTTNNNIIYINNNNNDDVVVNSKNLQENTLPYNLPESKGEAIAQPSIEIQISQLNLEREKLEVLDRQEGLRLSDFAGDSVAQYEHLKYLGYIRGKIDTIEKKIIKLQKTAMVTQEKQAKEKDLITQIDHMLKKPGERTIHNFTFNRLLKALELMGYKEHKLTWLINEIIFEIRFGSLTKSTATGEALSPDHAVNIALKLVRENRWTTPTLFKKSEGLQ